MREGFTPGEAVKLSGVRYDTLDFWDHSGFLSPSIRPAAGIGGSPRLYGFRDVVALKVAGNLRRQGVSLQGLRRVVAYLRDVRQYAQPLAEAYLIVDELGEVYEVQDGDELLALLKKRGQVAFNWYVLDLGAIVEELRERVAA